VLHPQIGASFFIVIASEAPNFSNLGYEDAERNFENRKVCVGMCKCVCCGIRAWRPEAPFRVGHARSRQLTLTHA
jgi:hypothetical protein